MNPLSLLFRALDSALRTLLTFRASLGNTPWRRRAEHALRSLRALVALHAARWRRHARGAVRWLVATPWRRHARSAVTALRTTPWREHARTAFVALRTTPWRQHARTVVVALRTTPWRKHARTVLVSVSDPRWWRGVGQRTVTVARRPRTLRLGVAALLGGAVIAATATTAAAVHTGGGAPAAQAAEQHAGADRHTAASRGQDRPAPGNTPSHAPAQPTQKRGKQQPAPQGQGKPAKPPAKRKPAAKRAPAANPYQYVDRGSSWRLPVQAKHYWISSGFGRRWGVLHAGVDLAVPMRTPVHAAHAGRVSIAGWYDGYGRAVGIENGQGIATVYGHNSKVLVHDGQWVRAGQVIALSGNTGDSHGPHVHFEMRRHGVPFNPLPYLNAHGLHVVRAAGHG
ncbi:hypothetical protein Athai_46390 [Actinocatenispora thailandica]|uniref:M23ase beta-sheet core domain-containing protein n=1 Tax=Actinocatenispora thailandica TaxID=227318 RepID=A0A7R7DSW1_9ACTN|nr:M23 family metallopeptidase [Actinocatenispora thailandica]BCJ37136.1 hypothetical protein Athai_46390 [Actinocatenispora thailandica]